MVGNSGSENKTGRKQADALTGHAAVQLKLAVNHQRWNWIDPSAALGFTATAHAHFAGEIYFAFIWHL
jgi:hypothetical protein